MIEQTDISYGPGSANRLAEADDPSADGALAALESFYYALNNRDLDALRGDWSDGPFAQLNNPVGGILRGGDAIAALYEKVFAGSINLQVAFHDVIAYHGEEHAVFAGCESGSYVNAEGATTPLEIRTSRYFRYEDGRWRQFHHHGSIDDPDALRAYQKTVRG
jgi:ketosteroid isomerase-like protein